MAQQFQQAAAKEAATDKATGLGGEWERFGFDSAAPLEEERDADADVDDADPTAGMGSGDALGGADDLAHLDRIKSSFVFSSFSNRGATTQEAHEHAIFGAPPTAPSEKLPRGQSSKASDPSRKDGRHADKACRPSDQGREERASEKVGERSDKRRAERRNSERNERGDERRDGRRGEGRENRHDGSPDWSRERRDGGRGRDERKEKEQEGRRGEQSEKQARAASSVGGCAAAVEAKFSLSGRKGGSSSGTAGAPDAFTAAVAAALGVEEEDDEESVPVIVGLVVDTRPAGESTRNAASDTLQPHAQAVQDEVAGVPAGTLSLVDGSSAGEAARTTWMESGAASASNGQQQAAPRPQVPSWKQRALQLKAARAASQQG
ncbi:unnamed protein product [Closterium sp. Yama58-4]|nr:unnamed protein product [Closterium sp. Yama58-4]